MLADVMMSRRSEVVKIQLFPGISILLGIFFYSRTSSKNFPACIPSSVDTYFTPVDHPASIAASFELVAQVEYLSPGPLFTYSLRLNVCLHPTT